MIERTVLITGASGAIGKAHCDAFRRSGWRVMATDSHDSASVDAPYYLSMDLAVVVADPEYRKRRFDEIRGRINGRLDCLVNNAALQRTGRLDRLDDEDIRYSFDVNVLAPMLLVRDFLPELRAAHGSVVNILSIHASLTKPEFSAYAASKAALAGLTRALAVDLAPAVRVNGVAPAAIDTPMLAAGLDDRVDLDELRRYHPSDAIGAPEDVADLSLYLANTESPFLTGSVVGLDGAIGSRLHDPC